MGDKRGCRSRTPLPPSYFNASRTHTFSTPRHQPLYYFILYRAGRGSKAEALSRSRGASESIIFHARTHTWCVDSRWVYRLFERGACLLCARVWQQLVSWQSRGSRCNFGTRSLRSLSLSLARSLAGPNNSNPNDAVGATPLPRSAGLNLDLRPKFHFGALFVLFLARRGSVWRGLVCAACVSPPPQFNCRSSRVGIDLSRHTRCKYETPANRVGWSTLDFMFHLVTSRVENSTSWQLDAAGKRCVNYLQSKGW